MRSGTHLPSQPGDRIPIREGRRFWQFSVRVYAAPGVEQECLALQDGLGIDVNLLLFCLWAGAVNGRLLSERDIGSIAMQARAWHESVVRPLRGVRRGIKGLPQAAVAEVAALRKQIGALELKAERIEQSLLARAADSGKPARQRTTAEIARANVAAYVRYVHGRMPPGIRIDAVLAAAARAA